MKVTTDDLKKDVEMLFDDLKRNYEIPSSSSSIKFLFKIIAVALVVQFFLSALDFYIWGGSIGEVVGKRSSFILSVF
ncbi:TPA: hypothetical protein KAC80_002342 [Escherichia coli]|uniref:Uncharacterized protein n=1 Tax=Escherichia coli TaxID=562 RepID=A0AAF0KMA1_ECOLX|nr:hypothetical protein [Escherichia coli]EFI5690176.1 hypothetical protein [Escherichia coli]WHI04905.1 hypothetical protein QDW62_28095 [Escherichia coli]SPW58720.1 Uncharacterised protein [Escherichia coli]HBB3145973.1 hypothetical protein [Escherichia coli]HBB3242029.1 hypothetical protein [Escherichia coli]